MLVRLFGGDDGASHFEDLDISKWPADWSLTLSNAEINFGRREPGPGRKGWHNESRRQYLITVAGHLVVTVGDGTIREFKAGDVLLAEDLTGQGHTTRVMGEEPWVRVTIPTSDEQ